MARRGRGGARRGRGSARTAWDADLQPRMRTRSERACARADDDQRGPVEGTPASKPQLARTARMKPDAAAAAEEPAKGTSGSSGKSDSVKGKRPAIECTEGNASRGDVKRSRLGAVQGTTEKQKQTDPVTLGAASQPDTSDYECPICISVLIAPVVSKCLPTLDSPPLLELATAHLRLHLLFSLIKCGMMGAAQLRVAMTSASTAMRA
jgi:hypothetical protein